MSKFASLTAGLLARKGEAEPAATPFADELLTRVGAPAADIRALTPMPHHHPHYQTHPPVPKPPAVKPLSDTTSVFGSFGRRSPAELERARHEGAHVHVPHDEEAVDNHCGSCPGPGADDPTKTFHVNLRLRRPRFVRLKLSAALLRRPVQEVVGEALDQWFDKLPPDVLGDCACLKVRGD